MEETQKELDLEDAGKESAEQATRPVKERIRDFFVSRRGRVITGVSAAVLFVAVGCTVFFVLKNQGNKAAETAQIPVETTQQTTAAPTEPATVLETEPEKRLTMKLEAAADESTITARVVDETGNPLTGYTFVVNLLQGSVQENQEAIDKVHAVFQQPAETTSAEAPTDRRAAADAVAQEINAQQFPDEDQDGEVAITEVEAGTYTLMVLAEQGFELPAPEEVTVTRHEVIENILDEVILEDENTRKEDPGASRNDTSTTENPPPQVELPPANDTPPEEDSKPVVQVITAVKRENGQIVYRAADSGTVVSLTDSQLADYLPGTVLTEQEGALVATEGFIYQTGTVETTKEGVVEVVTQFLTVADARPEKKELQEYTVLNLSPVVEETTQEVYENGWNRIGSATYYYMDGQPYTGWHWIDGLNYFFNANGVLSSRIVVDVSTYNGDIDWHAVKAAGIDYALIRVGYRGWGTAKLVLDSRFDQNMRGATAAGLQVGAYIVTQAVNTAEAVEEASFIVEKCRGYSVTLPLAIDVEWAGDRQTGEEGRANSLSAAARTSVINAFAETVQSAGYTPMVYANKNWMTNYINAPGIVSYCKVWVAQYADIDCTTYNGRFDMWQFRSDGGVHGIGGNVDMSAWVY